MTMAFQLRVRAGVRASTVVLLTALALTLGAQEVPFHTQSRVVLVPVTVTNDRGGFIDGLQRGDFELLDNGVPQPISAMDTAGTGVAPISLVIAIQSAGVSAPALAKIRRVGSMIVPLVAGEGGAVAVLTFDSLIHVLQDFTSDPAQVDAAFQAAKAEGDTDAHLLDAALLSIRMLRARRNTRRVLLLVSESRDRGSKTKLDEVVRAAAESDVTIYAASYSVYATTFVSKAKDVPPAGDPDFLRVFTEVARLGKTKTVQALAEATGGTTASFTRKAGLEKIVEELGSELHTQYVLSFVPADLSPGYHRLEVRLRNDAAYRVRARPGYQMAVMPDSPAGAFPAAPDELSHPRPE